MNYLVAVDAQKLWRQWAASPHGQQTIASICGRSSGDVLQDVADAKRAVDALKAAFGAAAVLTMEAVQRDMMQQQAERN